MKSEPVYDVKVFDAIDRQLSNADVDEAHRARLGELRGAWEAAEERPSATDPWPGPVHPVAHDSHVEPNR